MNPFGITRSVVARDHALLAPESFVPALLPGWEGTLGVILISPRMGAAFTQYLVFLEPEGTANAMRSHSERFLFVLEGEALLEVNNRLSRLGVGGYAYLPPGVTHVVGAQTSSRLVVFERVYTSQSGKPPPAVLVGQEEKQPGVAFMGDPDAVLQNLLPDVPAFDMAINLFTFQPGAALPQVEVHVMEHGLLMLAGAGVYRLGNDWYPVQAGDVIWMAPYCPQWFVAMGKTPARYLYYKDINRSPHEARV